MEMIKIPMSKKSSTIEDGLCNAKLKMEA